MADGMTGGLSVTGAKRVSPADCASEARRYTGLAYGKYEADTRAQLRMTLDAVDWLRRAVEQLAEQMDEIDKGLRRLVRDLNRDGHREPKTISDERTSE